MVLAAGSSRRFGSPKLLMPFGDSTVVASVVSAVAVAGVVPIIVVAGADAAAIASALAPTGAQIVRNPYPERGMVSSIRVGVAALPAALSRFLIALGDQPRIRAEAISYLIRAHQDSGKGIGFPTYRGKRGHPLILDLIYREAILALTDDQTLRDLVHAHLDDSIEVECDSDAVVSDMDTREQYEDELRRFHAEQ
ncbi:MAG: nucleotidyltransferase family protein [Armatimonadota bacterium]|nr:MAG: nucleotidyltransferase family protein [Armatimonadota bacterium]